MKKGAMLKRAAMLFTAISVSMGGAVIPVFADNADNTIEKVTAFTGAEGGGMYTKGARAALDDGKKIEVYHVTNLNDSGEGSFRDAVSKGNRIVVFDVSGMINLTKNISISNENITILGQTAPGDGICFRGDNIKVGTNNVILRYLRFRVGAQHMDGTVTPARDGLEITDDCQNVIIDHCSVSWGTDENLSAYAVKDVTIQNSIIAEALNQSVHDKGEHSYGAIWGGVNLSVHHNVIATHKSRNPKIGTSETVAMTSGYTDDKTLVDIHNNIFYNWGDKAGYGSENGAKTYLQNNIYKPGPATPNGKRARIFELSVGQKYKTNYLGSVYAVGNKIYADENDSDYADAQLVNENNWQDDKHIGVYVDNKFYSSADKTNMVIENPDEQYVAYAAEYPWSLDNTDDIYETILKNAGATLPKRDLVDERIIDNVRNRTAPNGSKGSVGLVDDPVDTVPEGQEDAYDSLGYPKWTEESRDASYDTDLDGIPDEWEIKMGLNPENPTDSTMLGACGRTFIETYVELASGEAELGFDLEVNGSNAFINSVENDTVDIYYDGAFYKQIDIGTALPDNCTLITATYDENTGALKECRKQLYIRGLVEDFLPATVSGKTKHMVWDSINGMQPVVRSEYKTSFNVPTDLGTHTLTAYSSKTGSYSGLEYIFNDYRQHSGQNYREIKGDFDVVLTLNNILAIEKDSYGEMRFSNGGVESFVGAGVNDSYEKTLYYGDKTVPMGNTKLLKLERRGNEITVYSGSSLLSWTKLESYAVTDETTLIYDLRNCTSGKYATDISQRFITSSSNPNVGFANIKENQRLGFKENIEVNIIPDGVPVQFVSISLNGTELASKDINAEENQTVEIPVEFSGISSGVLTVSCVDANLCTAVENVNVTVSADLSPWQIADIGAADNEAKTYASVTDDYTYKINAINGEIGGISDKFSYVYQQFYGNNRIYYRSRMQSADQFGIMIKKDLTGDGEAYFFGGIKGSDGKPVYKLMQRSSSGDMTEIADVTDITGQSANLYFVAEKLGDKINIYQTENGATIYKTKKLIAEADCAALGDEYYMGFAAVGGGNNPADAGWIGLEKVDSVSGEDIDTVSYTFENGLDWLWQMQEKNALRPAWENSSMKISPDSDYVSPRYIFHEYDHGDGNKVLNALVNVTLTGENPGLNIYFNSNNKDEAFKAELRVGEPVILGGVECDYIAEADVEYILSINVDEGRAADQAEIKLYPAADVELPEYVVVDNAMLLPFRSQNNVEKKTPVTNGIFFEPSVGAEGACYINNVQITINNSSIQKNIIGEHFWNFGASEEFSGLTALSNGGEYAGLNVIGGAAVEGGRNKTIDGIHFTSRYKIGGAGSTNSKCVYFTVPAGTTDITVYGESASSSATRGIVINDGQEHITEVTSAQSASYSFTSDEEKTIYVYGNAGINLYGISYQTYTMSE